MKSIVNIAIVLLLIGCSSNPDKSSSITVNTKIINDDFGGMGFHVFYHIFEAPDWHYNQVFAKRWRELNPAFARVTDIQDGAKGWVPVWSSRKQIDKNLKYLNVMKDTDTELYFTTWGVNGYILNDIEKYPEVTKNYMSGKHFSNGYPEGVLAAKEDAYIKKEVDNLEYIRNVKGFKNLNYYNMSNEMSLIKWGDMLDSTGLEYFKKMHQKFYNEFQKRKLDIKLLSTDASPISNWTSVEWAAENMDDISGVYGGHHYINDFDPLDNDFYPDFLDKMKWGAGIAKQKGKRFIIGEFGSKQNSNTIDSVYYDACVYNNTPKEPYLGTQIAEAMIAMINGGIYSAGYWTFNDFPPEYTAKGAINKWGVSKWEVDDVTTRAHYYSIGLITKFMRGPAKVFEVNSGDSLIRVAAIQNIEDKSVTIAIVNRNSEQREFSLKLDINLDKAFRKYVYDPENIPFSYFGDLQDYSKKVSVKSGGFNDLIAPQSLVVYTTKYDETAPAKVKDLNVEREENNMIRYKLSWRENTEDDFCYYRIYRSEEKDFQICKLNQIASTIATSFNDKWEYNTPKYYYKVVAVDNSGNVCE